MELRRDKKVFPGPAAVRSRGRREPEPGGALPFSLSGGVRRRRWRIRQQREGSQGIQQGAATAATSGWQQASESRGLWPAAEGAETDLPATASVLPAAVQIPSFQPDPFGHINKVHVIVSRFYLLCLNSVPPRMRRYSTGAPPPPDSPRISERRFSHTPSQVRARRRST